jgi:hypothetical protein
MESYKVDYGVDPSRLIITTRLQYTPSRLSALPNEGIIGRLVKGKKSVELVLRGRRNSRAKSDWQC